ncbi:hypothetical protein [Bacillus sp. Cr_A10]|uniref:hypothetical protein n=1 Tax=Bacillus sp. Cr_A10 TaxID=3033993 RepID=UPI0023DC5A87|nr:hypothetical protein [Bacillus sp. Cr_A10]MDF2066539.1 hypothetical protein [Bacillus sp. Cr_A10]
MKKLFNLCITVAFLILFIPAGLAAAQANPHQITITEVEKLIDQKLSEETPLTKEELQVEVNRLKDEKIANLEGNIGTVIDSLGLFIGVASLILVGITAIIGLIYKSIIGKKLTKIEELESTIHTTHTNIETKHKQIEEYHKQIKEFSEGLEKLKKQLNQNESLLEKREIELDDLRKYINAIGNIADSSIEVHKFLKEKQKSLETIAKTRDLLQRPLKNQDIAILKLSQKLGMLSKLTTLDSITNHLEYLINNLNNEEDSLWVKIQRFDSALELYKEHDEDVMQLHEEVVSNFNDWKDQLSYITIMKNHWEAHLQY